MIKLPEPARTIWPQILPLLDEVAEEYPEATLRIGGGTILAARWNHRSSTDVDLMADGARDLTRWERGTPGDAAARVGGEWVWWTPKQMKIRLKTGELDLGTHGPLPEHGSTTERVEGRQMNVLSTTQILRGKFDREPGRSPARDLYDVVTCAERDPDSLRNCMATLMIGEERKFTRTWTENRERLRREAAETLRLPDGRIPDTTDLIEKATAAVRNHRTEEITIRAEGREKLEVIRTDPRGRKHRQYVTRENAWQNMKAQGMVNDVRRRGKDPKEILALWESFGDDAGGQLLYDSRQGRARVEWRIW